MTIHRFPLYSKNWGGLIGSFERNTASAKRTIPLLFLELSSVRPLVVTAVVKRKKRSIEMREMYSVS